MIEAILMACTIAGVCKDVQLAVTAEKVTPYSCAMQGQVAAAKWIEAHPGWSPKKITCQRVGRYAKI
jgi:hypothetical protein